MSEFWPFLLAAALAFVAAVVWAGLRLWPVWRGRAPAGLTLEARVERWNRHLVPFLRRMMKGRSLVATVEIFRTPANGAPPQTGTVAVWCLVRTVVPDVDFLALARPVAGPDGHTIVTGEVLGAIRADRMREILGPAVPRQDLFGHIAHVYAWPPDANVEAIVTQLMPLDAFQAHYHWSPSPTAPLGVP